MFKKITGENVMMFAIKHYDNPQCEGEKEFHDDMKRFKYIKRLLRKHKETGILKERLLLNHIIILLITLLILLPGPMLAAVPIIHFLVYLFHHIIWNDGQYIN